MELATIACEDSLIPGSSGQTTAVDFALSTWLTNVPNGADTDTPLPNSANPVLFFALEAPMATP